MSRASDQYPLTVHSNTGSGVYVETVDFFVPSDRAVIVHSAQVIGGNPADADGDTVAIDWSYSTDGFSMSDVEIAVDAAAEYNDTDNTQAYASANETELTLTSGSTQADGTVRVPGGAVIRGTVTWTGSPADGRLTTQLWCTTV
jgi:hypothetical protein